MKSMKVGSMIVAVLFVANSFAQQNNQTSKKDVSKKMKSNTEQKVAPVQITPEKLAQTQTEKLDKIVGLTQDQKNKIYETNLAINNKNVAVHQHPTWSAEIKKEALEGNNAGRDELIKNYLTADQIAAWNASKANSGSNQ